MNEKELYEKYIIREEFDHFIAEFESFKDHVMDDIAKILQKIEILEEDIEDLKSKARKK